MDEFDLDFDTESMTEYEIEEMLDGTVESIGEFLQEYDAMPGFAKPLRIKQLIYTYKILENAAKGTGAKVFYEVHKPSKNMGFVTLSGANIFFNDSQKIDRFLEAATLASNVDIYPKVDGTVQIVFTFNGLTKAIGGKDVII